MVLVTQTKIMSAFNLVFGLAVGGMVFFDYKEDMSQLKAYVLDSAVAVNRLEKSNSEMSRQIQELTATVHKLRAVQDPSKE
jgi:hypothetical protein